MNLICILLIIDKCYSQILFVCVCVVLVIEPRGILPLSYTSSSILLLILKQDLTKLLRLALNL